MAQFHIIFQIGSEFIDYKLDAKGRILNHKFTRQKKRSHAELDPNAELSKNNQHTFVPISNTPCQLSKVDFTQSTNQDSSHSTNQDSSQSTWQFDWMDFDSLPWESETNSFYSPFGENLFPIEDDQLVLSMPFSGIG